MTEPVVGPSAHQLNLLQVFVAESARLSTVQLPGVFASREDCDPPLAQLVRLGEPALKLYLTLVLATRTPPHELYRGTSASRFARMLGYDEAERDEPASSGTRRIQRALSSLDAAKSKFISRTRRPGRVDLLTVNHFIEGLKRPYAPPYVTLPLSLWSHGWINVLSTPGLVVYVALRHACVGDESHPFHVLTYRRRQYGFSDETWRRGTQELVALGILRVTKGTPDDRDAKRRQRSIFHLNSHVLNSTPGDRRTAVSRHP